MTLGRTSFRACVFVALTLATGRTAEPAPAPTVPGPIVELPKFEVTDSRILPPPEKWHYAQIPGFEILSSVSERETKRFVRDFLLLQDAISVLMPALNRGDVGVPASLILCGRGDGLNRFLPVDRADETFSTNSLFFDDPERAAIVVDFALSELQLDAATTIESDPYRAFYKEYFRHLIRRQTGHPPPWFEEGLVQLFSGIDFDKKTITFAEIGSGRDAEFNRMLSQRALLPFNELFDPAHPTNDKIWAAEAYAFIHMCLYGRGQRYQESFVRFVARLGPEAPAEALFVECFKKTYKQMVLELRGYVDFTDHKYVQMRAKKGQSLPEPPPVDLREATEAEAGRMTGAALRLGGHGDAAHLALIAPYIRGAADPQLLAALGLDERMAGHDERARKFLEAAMAAKAVRPRAYLELARLRLAAVTAAAADPDKLSPAQIADVLAPLAIARSQPPPLAEIYEFMAEVWGRSALPPTRQDLGMINQGVLIFQNRPVLLARAAYLNLHHGDPEDARKIIVHALAVLPNTPGRVVIEQMRDELPPPPPAAALAAPIAPAQEPGKKP